MCTVSADGTSRLTKHTAPDPVDLITHFMDSVFEEACQTVDVIMDNDLPIAWTGVEQKQQHSLASTCYVCEGAFVSSEEAQRLHFHGLLHFHDLHFQIKVFSFCLHPACIRLLCIGLFCISNAGRTSPTSFDSNGIALL